MSRDEFVDAFGALYEDSPWIAEAAFERGIDESHDRPEALLALLAHVVAEAPVDRQRRLIESHPELAGRVAQSMTDASRREQSSAGLDSLGPDQARRFIELNRRYRERFGFPFILAVKGMSADAILDRFEKRLAHDPEREFAEALSQIDRIARLRLEAS